MSGATIEAVRQIVERGGEADDVLRSVVDTMRDVPGVNWVGIAFAEGGSFVLGPAAGDPTEPGRERVTIAYDGATVGELWADGTIGRTELEQVAALLGPYVLIGWDTGGEAWEP